MSRAEVPGFWYQLAENRGGAHMKLHEIQCLFMKFHTRLQSTDFVLVLVLDKILIPEDEDEKHQIRSAESALI
jgi:hypothetical protein